MIAIGISISLIFMSISNTAAIEEFVQLRMVAQAGGVIAGVGVLILIVSFGLYRRRKYKN